MKPESFSTAFEEIEQAAARLSPEQIPAALGELERLRSSLFLRLVSPPPPAPIASPAPALAKSSRILTAAEAGRRLGRSRWWIYRHASELPRTSLPGGGFGFSEASLDRWLRGRESR